MRLRLPTHIIFNKKLQEGWDDPSVYVCYFDGKTDSANRIQQVIGRALRQPEAHHYHDEELNTAYFFINCPSELLDKITDDLKEELRIYKGETETEFEPFNFQNRNSKPTKRFIPLRAEWQGKLKVLQLQAELPSSDVLERLIARKTFDFSEAERAASGKATVNIVSMRTGSVGQQTRDLLEDMRIACGTYLQEQIRARFKACANSIASHIFTNSKLDKTACYGSQALEHYRALAAEVVATYEQYVQLREIVHSDPAKSNYVVGAYQPTGVVEKPFEHSGHPYYDSKAFNLDELEMARALDRFTEYVWVRIRERVDYHIPLPVKSKKSENFYPDFLWWVKDSVWAIDPTGDFILEEKVRTKLMMVPKPLKIALVTRGKLNADYTLLDDHGWALCRFRYGNVLPQNFDKVDDLLRALVDES